MIKIKNLKASVAKKQILSGVNLNINKGEVVAIMGPNGSGKSSLASVVMGNPKFQINAGDILFGGKSILKKKSFERACLGIFMAHQNPSEIHGVETSGYLFEVHKSIAKARGDDILSVFDFTKKLNEFISFLNISDTFLSRSLNVGLSGGEKKKIEILQMLVINPSFIILDEIDSGLDVDALRLIAGIINDEINKDKRKAVLIITHSKKILNHIKPDKVLIMKDGLIEKIGGKEIIDKVEKKGFN